MKTNAECFMEDGRAAVHSLNVPCAPGGKIVVCQECADDPNIAARVFDKYRQSHGKRIQTFKTPGNPAN